MRRPLIAALAVTLTVGLISACDTMAPGQALPDMTMWQLIQNSTEPDGTMGLQASLVQFSYLIRPLPGVGMPPARPDPPGFTVSGTSAVNSVRTHWSELTDEQRRAVMPQQAKPSRLRSEKDPNKDAAEDLIIELVRDLMPKVAGRLGVRPLANRPKLFLEDADTGVSRAWTIGTANGSSLDTKATGCDMHIPPKTWTRNSELNFAWLRVTLAHELVHCHQIFENPTLASYQSTPKWVNDGFAEFAAIDLLGFPHAPTDNTWTDYLENDYPLYKRADGAAGWWFHLQHLGRDPWRQVPQLWQTGKVDQVAVYTAVGGDGDDVYDTWAASRLREARFGGDWQVYGTAVPSVDATQPPGMDLKPSVIEQSAQYGQIDIGFLEARPAKLTTPDDQPGVVRLSATNPIRVHDDAGFEAPRITEGDYCFGPTCTCPKNTERAGEKLLEVKGPLWLAVPGGEAGNSVRSDVVSLEDYCKRKRPDRKKPPAHQKPDWARAHLPGNSPGGSGQPGQPQPASTGDPHLTSLDGHNFDFQASGEFTLIRSDSGDLEIQTRQQPRIKFDGKESDAASMNTAVAANVAGDRVGFYADKDRPRVRVNGKPASGEQTLPQGGKISPIEAGYSVRWPDGTEMWVINAGAPDSVSVLFGPAESRKGKLHGLIGPFDGDAMFDRGGKRYDKPDFDQLYKKIGDSWRVGQSDSLFDYEPGQSTDTFTRRDLPVKPLTLADLSASERAAGEKACAGVTPALHEQCVFDVAVSGNDKLAVGYRTMDKLTTVGGGGLSLGEKIGPHRLEPGQKQTFTIDSDADTLYFATDADCTKPTSATVYWRITMPDGRDTLQVPMCADAGRQSTTKPGTWKVDAWVAPGAEQGGILAMHVAAAGAQREFDISLPKTITNGSLSGAGAEDRYRFTASAGDKVTLTSKSTCDSNRPLHWGLESPDGNRITLRTRVCDNLGEQKIPTAGTWSVAIYNSTADETPHSYGFSVTDH